MAQVWWTLASMCVSGYEGIIFRLETFSHSLFLQAPDKQKGKEKEYKTEIQRSRNVKVSINWFHLVQAVQEKVCAPT